MGLNCRRDRLLTAGLAVLLTTAAVQADMHTWDGRHSIERVAVTVIYFVPSDRQPLPDWRERVDYFCGRIEAFHRREYQGQSTLTTTVLDEPFVSESTTQQLRGGDGDFTFFRTLREVDNRLDFAAERGDAFPILLVLSDVNWRPLDDFYRLKPDDGGGLVFEGNYNRGEHFPGATSGGARATYIAQRGIGWGLVSADGWRVPYRGSDCVVYHEGVGHTVGLPHPEPGNGSVMSLGQYQGWISESWLDDDQKKKLGWKAADEPVDRSDLFSMFRALPEPKVPGPNEHIRLKCDWPEGASVKECRLRVQTDLHGPWHEVPQAWTGDAPETLRLGEFDRATPVSYRVDATLESGEAVELWGYLQVRTKRNENPRPLLTTTEATPVDLRPQPSDESDAEELDLLPLVDLDQGPPSEGWTLDDGALIAPKQYGARIELPYEPPEEYRLTVIAEPLDEPNGLILGQRSGDKRFLVLLNYAQGDPPASAVENVDGRNVESGPTTVRRQLFVKGRPSQIVCTVKKESVTVVVDGRQIIHWEGDSSRLSLSDYWSTPNANLLFVGAYDCGYRFRRIGVTPLDGDGRVQRRDGE